MFQIGNACFKRLLFHCYDIYVYIYTHYIYTYIYIYIYIVCLLVSFCFVDHLCKHKQLRTKYGGHVVGFSKTHESQYVSIIQGDKMVQV